MSKRAAAVVLWSAVVLVIGRPLIQAQDPPLHPTAALLRDLIRIDTSNPPGHEAQLDDWLAARLKPLGFDIEIVGTPEAGKSHLFARLKGDGSKRPILLAAHADVVGVEREKWTENPFGGVIRDEYVWGRGAIDFKGGIAVFARAVMMLAENKVPLARDVILLVEADEEAAPYNTTWLAQSHWPKMDCEFALNEGGWIIKGGDGKVKFVGISTADKISRGVTLTARGTSTHSSMPRSDSAIFALSKAMARLAEYETRVQLTPSTKQFFLALATTSPAPLAGQLRILATSADPVAVARAGREIAKDPLLNGVMRNTIAPVLMNAGFRSNVIPGSAEATVNVRLIPGTDPNAIIREIQGVIGDPAIEVKLVAPAAPSMAPTDAPASSENTELFQALVREARVTFPGAAVTPYLFHAGTDAGAWRSRGVPVYGIYPYAITAQDLTRMHGNDERVSIESLRQGTEMLYRTLVDVAGRPR
jgi:acetylornithine deacetylase/succinyl-diaminopimelate desuccinylase-like protein